MQLQGHLEGDLDRMEELPNRNNVKQNKTNVKSCMEPQKNLGVSKLNMSLQCALAKKEGQEHPELY